MNQLRLTAKTWPARLPTVMALAVGLYLLLTGQVFGTSGLLWIAGVYVLCRAVLSLSPRYRTKRRELAFWKGWEALVGSLNWRNKKNRDDEDVPDPELIAVDMSQADGDRPVQIVDFRPRFDSKQPRIDYGNWANQLALALGGYGMEYDPLAERAGGPVIRVRIAMAPLDAPPPLTAPPAAPFGVFPIGKGADGQDVAWHPFAHEMQFGIFAGEPGTGKSSTLRLLAATPYQWEEPVQVIVATPKPADFNFLTEEPWKERATIHGGITDARAFLRRLRVEVERRNMALDSPEARGQFERATGGVISRQPSKIHEMTPEARVANKMDFWLVIVDELAAILTSGRKQSSESVNEDFKKIIAESRSAGIMVAIGIHRPDVAIMGGYTRDLIGVRVLHGRPKRQPVSMLFEHDYDAMFDLERYYPPGTILYQGLGDPPSSEVRRGRVAYLDPDYLHPVVGEPEAFPDGELPPVGGQDPGDAGERGWEDRARWWLRTLGRTCRLVLVRQYRGVERDVDFRGTLLKTRSLACVACGRGGRLAADHRIPLWAGGADDPHANGQLLCVPCHSRKTRMEAPVMQFGARLPALAMQAAIALGFVAWLQR